MFCFPEDYKVRYSQNAMIYSNLFQSCLTSRSILYNQIKLLKIIILAFQILFENLRCTPVYFKCSAALLFLKRLPLCLRRGLSKSRRSHFILPRQVWFMIQNHLTDWFSELHVLECAKRFIMIKYGTSKP